MVPHSWGFLDHTKRHTTVGRTPLDEWSVRLRDLYLTTQNTHNRQTSMLPGRIRTHNPSRRAAVDLRLRPRSHWDRPLVFSVISVRSEDLWLMNLQDSPAKLIEPRCKQPSRCNKFRLLILLDQLYLFRATNSPTLRSAFWLYIQLLVQCTDIAADRWQPCQ